MGKKKVLKIGNRLIHDIKDEVTPVFFQSYHLR